MLHLVNSKKIDRQLEWLSSETAVRTSDENNPEKINLQDFPGLPRWDHCSVKMPNVRRKNLNIWVT